MRGRGIRLRYDCSITYPRFCNNAITPCGPEKCNAPATINVGFRDDGNVYAVDAETGRQIWKRVTNVTATPAIADGTLYIGSCDGNFYALNAHTGALKWKVTTEGERRFEAKDLHGLQPKNQTIGDSFDIFLSPVVANGAIYFGSADVNLYALDSATGDLRWKFKTGDVVRFARARVRRFIFSEAGTATSMQLTLRLEKEKWRFHADEDPVIHNQVGFHSSFLSAF